MPDQEPDFLDLLRRLNEENVSYVLIGGMAMVLHGSSQVTQDLDLMYERKREQAEAIERALGGLHPRLRDLPESVPNRWDAQTLMSTSICTLQTDAGALDLIAEAPGAPPFEAIVSEALDVDLDGIQVKVASPRHLLQMKRALPRNKDAVHIAELEELLKDEL